MITEVCGMIRAAQENDSARVLVCARLLAENLHKSGDHNEGNRLLRALGDLPSDASRPCALDDLAVPPVAGKEVGPYLRRRMYL